MIDFNREELAWAAGFFDGEGTSFFYKQSKGDYPYITASIHQSGGEAGKALLERFRNITHLGKVTGPYRYGKPTWQPRHHWTCYGFEQVQALMAMLWTFLGTTKRQQFNATFLKFNHTTTKRD